jgi:hypothetical protein
MKRRTWIATATVIGVGLLVLGGGGVAGADSSAPGWAALGMQAGDLHSITCPAASTCVGVGDMGSDSVRVVDGAGAAWTPTSIGLPGDARTPFTDNWDWPHLKSVSCSSADNCAAIGVYSSVNADRAPMIEVKSGGVWQPSAVAIPVPWNVMYTQPLGSLSSVSCSALICVAVGQYDWWSGDHPSTQGLLVSGTGDGTWSTDTAPLPADASAAQDTELNGVSCVDSECVVVGRYKDTSGQLQGLLLTYANGAWQAVQAPLPVDAMTGEQDARLDGVDCPVAGSCSAAGSFIRSNGGPHGQQRGLLLSETGGVWSATEATLPPGAPTNIPGGDIERFNAIDCSAAGECAAAGYVAAGNSGGESLPLVVAEQGGAWEDVASPALPPGAQPVFSAHGYEDAGLFTVSCSSPGLCDAAGWYTLKNTDQHALLVELNGDSWSAAALPVPTDAYATPTGQDSLGGSGVFSLSCIDGVGCEGVGGYTDSALGGAGVLIVVNGDPVTGAAKAARATTAHGTASVTVSCIGQSPCDVAFDLRTKNRKTVIGTATGTVAAGDTTVIPVTLNARGKALLKKTPKSQKLASSLEVTEGKLVVSHQRPLFKR